MGVKSGSNNGFHIIFKDRELRGFYDKKGCPIEYAAVQNVLAYLPNKKYKNLFERIEFRWIAHLVLPPSNHILGKNYSFVNGAMPSSEPKEIDHEVLTEIISSLI